MPEPTTPSGAETGSPENTTVNKYSPEIQAIIDEMTAKVSRAEAERKKANDEAANYRIREKEADQRKLTEEASTAVLRASLERELGEFKSLSETQKSRLDAVETARRKELLARLPQDKARNYQTVDLNVLEMIAGDFAAASPVGNSQGNERGAAGSAIPSLEGMTLTELYQLMQSNPTAYTKLMKGI